MHARTVLRFQVYQKVIVQRENSIRSYDLFSNFERIDPFRVQTPFIPQSFEWLINLSSTVQRQRK